MYLDPNLRLFGGNWKEHYSLMRFSRFEKRSELYLRLSLLVSLAMHVLVFIFIFHDVAPRFQEEVFAVEIVSPEVLRPQALQKQVAQRQFVSESQGKEAPDSNAALLAEKNVAVEKEQVKRGDAPDAGEVLGKQNPQPPAPPQASGAQSKAAPAPPKPAQPAKVVAPPKDAVAIAPKAQRLPLKQLVLDDSQVSDLLQSTDPKQSKETQPSTVLDNYSAFNRPQGSGAAFIGLRGDTDFLPGLPDGDITLLNTKADKFAVFVRRVASQVFGQLRTSGWESLSAGDLNSMRGFSEVRATLSPKGELLSVRVIAGSGSPRFDEVLAKSVKSGARDPNPPADAVAADGNIQFIFQARSWAQYGAGARGGPSERRWLLLATGLE